MIAAGAVVALVGAGLVVAKLAALPPDTKPEGAYLRIASSLSHGDLRGVFRYLEDDAADACANVLRDRKEASDLVDRFYPEPERTRLLDEYRPHATAAEAADVWVEIATRRGYGTILRHDLSGIARIETDGDRAIVETARGTRYSFRRRRDGVFGLATFTADLVADATRARRDLEVIKKSAADYERVGK
jgi:hypothetical protein